MSVELRPLGVKCNLRCPYCYQNPQRVAGNVADTYDIARMMEAVEAEGGPFTLFGGEALLIPKHDLETLFAWGKEKYGRSSIQTNATLIDADHIEMFKKYSVSVGMSLDGPLNLNDTRWAGSLSKTRELSSKSLEALDVLLANGIWVGLIVTLHARNAGSSAARLELKRWFLDLESKGMTSVRLHVLESENEAVRARYGMSQEKTTEVFLDLLEFGSNELTKLRFDVLDEVMRMLNGKDAEASCVWKGCDTYTTSAVRGVEGFGQRSNCGRTNKEGIDFVKSEQVGFERYIALYNTSYEAGGCQGCRFFLSCKGYCPGTAIDGDWRNRTEHCSLWMNIFIRMETKALAEGKVPISMRPDREQLEKMAIDNWTKGEHTNLHQLLTRSNFEPHLSSHPSGHGDHTDHGDAML